MMVCILFHFCKYKKNIFIVFFFLLGLIGATFTDLRVLSGPDTQKCFYWYGSTRAKVAANQEVFFINNYK